jgi:hypothetical protein
LQLLSISKTSSPPPSDTGDVMARFMARLVTEHNIPHSDLTDLFNSCLQAALDDPPSGTHTASVYTLSAVRNMIQLHALATVDDGSQRKRVVRGLSLSANRLHLHVGGEALKSHSEDSSDDDHHAHPLSHRDQSVAFPQAPQHGSTAVDVMLAAASASHAASAESSDSRAESAASELPTVEESEQGRTLMSTVGVAQGSAHLAWQQALETAVNAKSLEVTSPDQPSTQRAKDA